MNQGLFLMKLIIALSTVSHGGSRVPSCGGGGGGLAHPIVTARAWVEGDLYKYKPSKKKKKKIGIQTHLYIHHHCCANIQSYSLSSVHIIAFHRPIFFPFL